MLVVFHLCSRPRPPRRHEVETETAIARRLAAVLGFGWGGESDGARHAGERLYYVPDDTLTIDEALGLGIRGPDDLFGGVVPFPFVATKAITHGLNDPRAAAPAGWSPAFAERVRDVVLPGVTAFAHDDALAAGRRLLQEGRVRLKATEGIGGSGQQVVVDEQTLVDALDAIAPDHLSRTGIVVEADLARVATHSVGQVRVGRWLASYWGTQRLTRNNQAAEVYGGSDLTVVRGDFDALEALPMPPALRLAVAQARVYHEAALASFAGMFVSRCNYDVAQGVDAAGNGWSGVLEQSWRIGGATGAEVAALEAFAADPRLMVARACTREVYGEQPQVPVDATVYFSGFDEHAGHITKYARLQTHADA